MHMHRKTIRLKFFIGFGVQLEATLANVINSIWSISSSGMRFYEPVNQIKRKNSHLFYPIRNAVKRLPITNGNSFRYNCGKWLVSIKGPWYQLVMRLLRVENVNKNNSDSWMRVELVVLNYSKWIAKQCSEMGKNMARTWCRINGFFHRNVKTIPRNIQIILLFLVLRIQSNGISAERNFTNFRVLAFQIINGLFNTMPFINLLPPPSVYLTLTFAVRIYSLINQICYFITSTLNYHCRFSWNSNYFNGGRHWWNHPKNIHII